MMSWQEELDQMPERLRKANQRMQMQAALGNLPAPMNEVEISMPELMEEEADTQAPLEEDQADADKRREKEEQLRLEIERQKQSQPVKMGLPRPVQTSMMIFEASASQGAGEALSGPQHLLQQAESMLHEEMANMITRDAVLFPVKGAKPPKKAPPEMDVSLEELKSAADMLEEELHTFSQAAGGELSAEAAVKAAFEDGSVKQFVFLPSAKRFVDSRLMGKKERAEAAKHQFEMIDANQQKELKRVKKLEEKMERLLGGYTTKARQALLHIRKLTEERETVAIETEVFETLRAREEKAIETRVEELQEQVEREKNRNKKLQNRFKEVQKTVELLNGKLQ